MSYIEIIGKKKLQGEILIQGSKNAVLPILAASVLNQGVTKLKNCPKIQDVTHMINILISIGCLVTREGDQVIIDASNIDSVVVPEEFVTQMRASIIFLGAIIGRKKQVVISHPGGCRIGSRPINLHLKALKKLNIKMKETENDMEFQTDQILGNEIVLDFPSVGATENIILASVLSEGITNIIGAAKEPEIIELCMFLRKAGARIKGDGTDQIHIEGVRALHDVEYKVPADRIVAGTYMTATAAAGGEVTLLDVDYTQLYSVISVLKESGCRITYGENRIHILSEKRMKSIDIIQTAPYPGFPTDMQSQIMAALATAEGTSVIVENIFESRYNSVGELAKMGADIIVKDNVAIMKGTHKLRGANVSADDLRGGAALVIAGLCAEGLTKVSTSNYIERGYEDICRDLTHLGADITYHI